MRVRPLSAPLPPTLEDPFENKLYTGSENHLEVTQRFRIKYECAFDLTKFPFDAQSCKFPAYLKLMNMHNLTHRFRTKDAVGVKYNGTKTIDQFEVKEITFKTGSGDGQSWFTYQIDMQRNFMSQVISTFFPTCLLWLLAYFTIFINVANFNNRFMGSVTFMLVLVSLRGSIVSDLPTTSYFKYIDLWFFWYISNIFFIIAYHIIIDNISSLPLLKNTNRRAVVMSISAGTNEQQCANDKFDPAPQCTLLNQKFLNNIAMVLFPLATICFNILYFYFSVISAN